MRRREREDEEDNGEEEAAYSVLLDLGIVDVGKGPASREVSADVVVDHACDRAAGLWKVKPPELAHCLWHGCDDVASLRSAALLKERVAEVAKRNSL